MMTSSDLSTGTDPTEDLQISNNLSRVMKQEALFPASMHRMYEILKPKEVPEPRNLFEEM